MKAPLMRSLNGIELLNLISEHGPISRASLAKLSELSKPTVSSQVEALVRQGWVVELGQGEAGAKGGKKPNLVGFNARAGRLFGAEINADEVRIAVADLSGNIQDRSYSPIGKDRSAESVLAILRTGLKRFMKNDGHTLDQQVISVAAPGRVDMHRGVVLDAGNLFNWRNVKIRETLEESLGVSVFVDNGVKMATLGEVHYGVAKGEQDVVVVRLDTGIGSGIVVHGKLVHGSNWAAGEIAHMVLDLSRVSEDWRVRGYLESIVGSDRIVEQAEAAEIPTKSAMDFLSNGRQAGGEAAKLYEKVVLHVGVAIANLICAYDPSLVVLQGALFSLIGHDLRAVVERTIPWETRIEFSEISDEAVLLGAIVSARRQAYDRISRLFDGHETSRSEADLLLEAR